jgi:hypothetical protein
MKSDRPQRPGRHAENLVKNERAVHSKGCMYLSPVIAAAGSAYMHMHGCASHRPYLSNPSSYIFPCRPPYPRVRSGAEKCEIPGICFSYRAQSVPTPTDSTYWTSGMTPFVSGRGKGTGRTRVRTSHHRQRVGRRALVSSSFV